MLLKKYYTRRRHRIEDYLNKPAVQLSREFPDTVFVFEDLNKLKMLENGSRKFNRKPSRSTWSWGSPERGEVDEPQVRREGGLELEDVRSRSSLKTHDGQTPVNREVLRIRSLEEVKML